MKYNATLLILVFLFCGCLRKENKKNVLKIKLIIKKLDTFNLKRDVFDFSSKMNEMDTLFLYANLSVCTSWWVEKNMFVKKNGEISLLTNINNDVLCQGDESVTIESEYCYSPTDSLNFEDLFKHMSAKEEDDKDRNSTFLLVCKKDTMRYYSYDLVDKMQNVDFYIRIKRRLFPGHEAYKSIKPPPRNKRLGD